MNECVIFLLFSVGLLWTLWPWAKKPGPGPLPSRSRAVHVDLPEVRAAIHEAGHTVVAWCCTHVTDFKFAKANKGGGGQTSFSFAGRGVDSAWCQLVISLAGPVAEAMVYKKGRSLESAKDLKASLVSAERIGLVKPPWAPRSGATFEFDKLFFPRPSESARRNLEEGYRMAKQILVLNEIRVHAVAEVLVQRGSVEKSALEEILGSRRGMPFLYVIGQKFVLPNRAVRARGA